MNRHLVTPHWNQLNTDTVEQCVFSSPHLKWTDRNRRNKLQTRHTVQRKRGMREEQDVKQIMER